MDLCFLKSAAAQAASYAVALRREIHSHPELSDREEQTSALVCRELERLNIPYTVLPGMHGVVGMISSGREGPTVALRADMDALPIQEQTGLAFASQKEGVMHACGHDVHTAVLLGTASVLAENKALFRGNVKLFFQPAEEGVGGAKRMIAAGCMENPHVEAVFGLHSAPRLPAGKIGTKPGWTSASSDEIKIRVHGKSAHGASPDEGVDAIYIASQLVVALYGLMARRVRGTDSIALNVGKFHAGNRHHAVSVACRKKCRTVFRGIMVGQRHKRKPGKLPESRQHLRGSTVIRAGRKAGVHMEIVKRRLQRAHSPAAASAAAMA